MVGRNLFKIKADPLEALVPLAQISAIPMVLYTNPQTQKKSVTELVDPTKAPALPFRTCSVDMSDALEAALSVRKTKRPLEE